MNSFRRRFNIFGIIIVLAVGIALFIQFNNFNGIQVKQTQMITSLSRDALVSEISSNLMEKAQVIAIAADYISANEWNDDELSEYLAMLTNSTPSFSMIYFGKPSNVLISGSGWVPPEAFDLRLRPWYIKAKDEKRLVFSEVFTNAAKEELIITISKPVYNERGELLGVMAGDVSVESITAIINNKKLDKDEFSFIVDGKGNMLAHPYYRSSMHGISEISKGISSKIRRDGKGIASVVINGQNGYLAYQSMINTDWMICSFVSANKYMENEIEYLRIFILTLTFTVFLFFILILLEKKYFLNPIISFDNDIQRINIERDITYRIPETDRDPLIHPRQSINTVLNKTQEYFCRLEAYEEELIANNNELDASLQQLAAAEKELWSQNEQLKISQEELRHLSYHDQLTGLYNRRFLVEAMEKLDMKDNYPLALIMADVNGLKLINDSFGHAYGDELLVKTAEVIRSGCREGDIAVRVGGDEFVILLPKTDAAATEKIVKKIKSNCSKERVASIELSVSFGWEIKVNEYDEINVIYKKAEDHLYKRKLFESPSMRGKTINVIIKTLHEKNKREEMHSVRVSTLCENMGKALKLSETEIQELKTAGLLHDIGKIAINESILNKAGKLNEKEREEINNHPEIGYRILCSVNDMSDIAEYVLSHHERWDGSGYPRGLKGEEIPIQARILAIADAYDAMTSERTYRSPLSAEAAIKELGKNKRTQFDPELVEVFIENIG